MENSKAIVNLKFKSDLSTEELCEIAKRRKSILQNVKGLITLFCYTNEETNTIGGTYIFENLQLAHQYLGEFLTKGVGPEYGVIPMTLKIDVGCLKDEIIVGDR
ncbi:hypothetical protein AWE51_15000 [Aquimarina aggregata]|uniref:Monooxygenase n=1 Tax=Aquimarina aggregata TaxID=1642818 RepID=A0A162Y1S4_9FLAO|nr:YdhR family protein [Aquimarina aggregata]KZS38886.1 hypothetical protein AWE51_15000 [Aquimarina aggregata]